MISIKKIKAFIKSTLNKITFYRLDKYLNYRFEKKKFYQRKGYPLNLKQPRSFSEKVVWKKLYDRNPLIPITADKYLARFFVKEVLGEDIADDILVPLLSVNEDPDEIPFEQLPVSYIIKPNHGSGMYMIVDGIKPDPDKIIDKCKSWLEQPYGIENNEWAYRNIKRKILIEKLLKDERGQIPDDYKFFVFKGKSRFLYVVKDRLSGDKTKSSVYTPDWKRIQVQYYHDVGPDIKKPPNLDEMIGIAERLGEPFDFVRVDLYSTGMRIYFGELTNYPISGRARIEPLKFDFEFGSYWEIKPFYWRESIKSYKGFIEKLKKQSR